MGRLLVVVGILLLIVSFFAPLPALLSSLTDIGSPDNVPQAAMRVCGVDEELETDTRAGGVTTYYCVGDGNARRDVTVDVMTGEGGLMSTGMSGVFNYLIVSGGLSLGGIVCIIVGVWMVRRSNLPQQVVGVQGNNFSAGGTSSGSANFGSHDSGSMMGFMRDQLDDAYRSGKISREDYERAIEQLNRR